ncbi:MAG TPA: TIR domain-containing protein, partial [Pyrinomonadaceae bacterium]
MAPQSAKPAPLELFYSYSHKDKKLRDKVDNHLSLLQRQEFITEWHDRMIEAGDDWESEISEHLESAQLILLLVSDDFIASDYCYSVEMNRALERHEQEEARVIPVILRPVDWESSPLGRLQALPEGGKAVTTWRNRDEALKSVAKGIRKIVRSFRPKQKSPLTSSPIPRRPVYGFVPRREDGGRYILDRLKEELAPGQDQLVTLSGPGGIGKTTLAAEAARALQEAYKGRVVWSGADGRADYTLLSLLDDIATQLKRAELRTLAPAEKAEQARAVAAGALVVLDNYETVAEAERALIEAWFKQTQCSALFTSRPRVPDTVFVPVSAMSPEEAAEFLEKVTAQTQDPQLFTPDIRERIYETAEKNPFVMQWVVGQIDLAQEPGAVLEELQHGGGDVAERIFDRSFDLPLLGEDGRDALLALSLFAPSATPEALAAVSGFNDEGRVREAIKNLRRLWLVKGVDGNRRLAVEGLTRRLAAARLSKDPRADEFRRRFIAYFLRYTEEHKEPTPENYDALEGEKDNLLSASEAAFASGDGESVVRMAFALARGDIGMLYVRGYWGEAVKFG